MLYYILHLNIFYTIRNEPAIGKRDWYIANQHKLIMNGNGGIIARRSFDGGKGMLVSKIPLDNERKSADIDCNKYWIEDMPAPYTYAWENYNRICEAYYHNTAKPYYIDHYVE
jgi:hypothetical protein